MRCGRRWVVSALCVAGLLSGSVVRAQDQSVPPPGATEMVPGQPAAPTERRSTRATRSARPVDLNTADEATLKSLRIGPVRARAIIAYRQEHGPFQSIDDLKKVRGFSDAIFDKIKGQITVSK